MPLTPAQAFQRSPAVKMSDDERAAFDAIKKSIDDYLMEHWTGLGFGRQIAPCSPRVIAYIVRAYGLHDWNVQSQALDGQFQSAAEILRTGGEPGWILNLSPRWTVSVE